MERIVLRGPPISFSCAVILAQRAVFDQWFPRVLAISPPATRIARALRELFHWADSDLLVAGECR